MEVSLLVYSDDLDRLADQEWCCMHGNISIVLWVMKMVALGLNYIIEHGDDIVYVNVWGLQQQWDEKCKFLPIKSPWFHFHTSSATFHFFQNCPMLLFACEMFSFLFLPCHYLSLFPVMSKFYLTIYFCNSYSSTDRKVSAGEMMLWAISTDGGPTDDERVVSK